MDDRSKPAEAASSSGLRNDHCTELEHSENIVASEQAQSRGTSAFHVRNVGLAVIAVLPDRMRVLRREVVNALAESMKAQGILQPRAEALEALGEAIYLHEARQYHVDRFNYDERKAYVRSVNCDYFTQAIDYTQVKVLQEFDSAEIKSAACRKHGKCDKKGRQPCRKRTTWESSVPIESRLLPEEGAR